nr:MAG TPA: hypothetical protein [Crassvirales sp.]
MKNMTLDLGKYLMIQVISLQFVASSVVGISPNSPGSIVTHLMLWLSCFVIIITH